MALSLAELVKPVSKDEQLTTLLELATLAGFPATSWQSGSVPRTLLEVLAEQLATMSELIAAIAKGGLLDWAETDWLSLLTDSLFDVRRLAAVKTQGTGVLSCSALAGPYTISVGQLVATNAAGKQFRNITGGTLASGGTLELTFEAEVAGSVYNLGVNTLTILLTPLAGVTIDNPVIVSLGTWITQSGTDEETDAQLRLRCRAKWATLGTGSTVDAYVFWALTASPEVKRVLVREHDNAGVSTDGHVTLYLAGDAGPVDAGVVTTVSDYIAARRPLTATIHVLSAIAHPVAITATQLIEAAAQADAEASTPDYLEELFRGFEIGGTVYRSAIIEQLMRADGMINTVLAAPAADVALAFNEVATRSSDTLTWTNP